MVNPVPGGSQGTAYGVRGPYWSCRPDAYGNGIHTGRDYPAAAGTKVVAARPGTVVYCNHGSAFGNHQLEIKAGDGTRDFYAHMRSRAVGNGAKVKAGQKIGEVGSEGNSTGPHLHFERHNVATGPWSCSVITDPKPSVNWEDDDMPLTDDDVNKIATKVNHILGDYHTDGSKRDGSEGERANQRLTQIENVVRNISDRLKKIENKLD